jgi:hypothetical protein
MTQYLRVVWPKNSEIMESPAKRIVNLAYEHDQIGKAQIDFAIKVGATNSYLSSDVPIKINGKPVKIADLPQNSNMLGDIGREGIEVGHLLKFHPDGQDNMIEVNFVNKAKKFFSKKPAGTMNMILKIEVPDRVVTVEKKVDPVDKIFCIFCGASIQADSMYCPYGGQLLTTGGTEVKECKNCGEALPPIANYCRKCQSVQGESTIPASSEALEAATSPTDTGAPISSDTSSSPGMPDPYSSTPSGNPFDENPDSTESGGGSSDDSTSSTGSGSSISKI